MILVFLYCSHKKITFYKNRIGKKKIPAEFIEYKWITIQVSRNDYHTYQYPFVEIYEEGKSLGSFELNFKNFMSKEFMKGEKIDMFWDNNELLHWNAYDVGIMKYIPKKWPFSK